MGGFRFKSLLVYIYIYIYIYIYVVGLYLNSLSFYRSW